MTTDTRPPYPRCERCSHPWHGLPCIVRTTYLAGQPQPAGPCNCPSAYDDDYWTPGDTE